MLEEINKFLHEFLKEENKNILIFGNCNVDGIIASTIFSRIFEKLDMQFSIKNISKIDNKEINLIPKNRIVLLLDIGFNNLEELSKISNKIYIINHKKIPENLKIPKNITILNPLLSVDPQKICTSEISYMISRPIIKEDSNLANLCLIARISKKLENKESKINEIIIKDSNVTMKQGFLLCPVNRPLDKSLEYSSNPFIPEISGNQKGAMELIKEAQIEKTNKNHKSLIELSEVEMQNLSTAILQRIQTNEKKNYYGNYFLINLYNKKEDARELCEIINACCRMKFINTAFLLCLGRSDERRNAEKIYVKYRQNLISGLNFVNQYKKIEGRDYIIINAQNNIEKNILQAITEIISHSFNYDSGKIIIAMAYNKEKIKIFARLVGSPKSSTRNIGDLLESISLDVGGISKGRKDAANCIIDKKQEIKFINLIKKKLEIELINTK